MDTPSSRLNEALMDYLLQGFIQGFVLLFSGNAETYSAIFATVGASTLSMIASLTIGIPDRKSVV